MRFWVSFLSLLIDQSCLISFSLLCSLVVDSMRVTQHDEMSWDEVTTNMMISLDFLVIKKNAFSCLKIHSKVTLSAISELPNWISFEKLSTFLENIFINLKKVQEPQEYIALRIFFQFLKPTCLYKGRE